MMREVMTELGGLVKEPWTFWELSRGAKVTLGVLVAVGAHVVVRAVRGPRKPRYDDPPNTVVVYPGPPCRDIPTPVPFGMKLETFCRMAGIPYKRVPNAVRSSKGKMPFLRYNGQEVADSGFCLQFLSETFHKDLNRGLTPEQQAIGRALTKMLEENTYWVLVVERMLDNPEFASRAYGGPSRLLNYLMWLRIRSYVSKMVWYHGIGRHSRPELLAILEADLQAVSTLLGDKAYLFGSEPCEVDCAVFGMLSEALWEDSNPVCQRLVREKFPNIRDYLVRIKERYWQDWDSLLTGGKAL